MVKMLLPHKRRNLHNTDSIKGIAEALSYLTNEAERLNLATLAMMIREAEEEAARLLSVDNKTDSRPC